MVILMAINTASREELTDWLQSKPRDWSRVIALRAALRVTLFCFEPTTTVDWSDDARFPLAVMRANVISTVPRRISVDSGIDHALAAAADAAREEHALGTPASEAALAALAYDAAYNAANTASTAVSLVNQFFRDGSEAFWQQLSSDCLRLEDEIPAEDLLTQPLWNNQPIWFRQVWDRSSQWLSQPGPEDGFDIWHEWYSGRVQGLPRAFKHFDENADETFYRWVVERDDAWWRRPPRLVNADIKAKVEELRNRPPPSDEELAQEPRAFTFSLTADGRSDLDSETLPNGLQGDEDERDNHSEILRLIDAASLATSGDTNAKDMDEPTHLLRETVGESVEELRPRMFVLRARELMRQVEERESGESLKPALSEKQRDAYVPLVAALGMIAEFSPKLAELWYGKLGQTGPPLTREMLDLIAQAFRQSQQTTELAQSIIEASNALVDPDAPEDDAARIAASETSRNVVRKIGGAIKKADEGAKSVDRVVRLSDRAIKIWNSLKGRLPSDETIARILEWISGGA